MASLHTREAFNTVAHGMAESRGSRTRIASQPDQLDDVVVNG